ncbi:Hypothetical protein KVN_LOCUS467 [uncultured virus]|nr:Hypothetical protein KVN_LOCUS467 [uncultured virus]
MNEYKLVNPFIQGNFTNIFKGSEPLEAAQNVWKTLSGYFTNNLPKFAFSLQNAKDKTLSHFLVQEKIKDDNVNYEISEINQPFSKTEEDAFINKLNDLQQETIKGGRRRRRYRNSYDDEDDDEDDDFDDLDEDYDKKKLKKMYNKIKYQNLIKTNQPIIHWWYNPLLYKLPSVYIPTFIAPISPYVEIQLSTIF